jgi:folylpolyglutamate synthase/dihydropteroate synthase
MECMAVKPDLIHLISDRMTQPDIVVITNCQVDHLEEQGSSRAAIARSLAQAIRAGSYVFSGEQEPEAQGVLIREAEQRNAMITFVSADEVSDQTRE